jgi:hypothetical protein
MSARFVSPIFTPRGVTSAATLTPVPPRFEPDRCANCLGRLPDSDDHSPVLFCSALCRTTQAPSGIGVRPPGQGPRRHGSSPDQVAHLPAGGYNSTARRIPAAWPVATRKIWPCTGCDHQLSLTTGTVPHKTHTAVSVVLGVPDDNRATEISAVQLQRQIGLSPHQTACTMRHKLRRGMTNPSRTLVVCEVAECEVGGREPGRRSSRGLTAKAVEVIIAGEVRGLDSGRDRMMVIHEPSGDTSCGFVTDSVEPEAITVHSAPLQVGP